MTFCDTPDYKQELKSAVTEGYKKSITTALMVTGADRLRQYNEPSHGLL